jgi:hypothetical protein
MCTSDGSVDAHGLGDLGRRPFGLVYVEVEEDAPSRGILQRGDGSVDLAEWFITHAGSLSTANADVEGKGRPQPLLTAQRPALTRQELRFEGVSQVASWTATPNQVSAVQADE